MTETEWLKAQAQALAQSASSYEDRAFFTALEAFIQAQAERLEHAEGELDGRTWDHEGW